MIIVARFCTRASTRENWCSGSGRELICFALIAGIVASTVIASIIITVAIFTRIIITMRGISQYGPCLKFRLFAIEIVVVAAVLIIDITTVIGITGIILTTVLMVQLDDTVLGLVGEVVDTQQIQIVQG